MDSMATQRSIWSTLGFYDLFRVGYCLTCNDQVFKLPLTSLRFDRSGKKRVISNATGGSLEFSGPGAAISSSLVRSLQQRCTSWADASDFGDRMGHLNIPKPCWFLVGIGVHNFRKLANWWYCPYCKLLYSQETFCYHYSNLNKQ